MLTNFAIEQLHVQIAADITARTAEHQGSIARFKLAQNHALARTLDLSAKRPLALLAHGDSWFDYPLHGNAYLPFTRTDIVHHLGRMGDMPPLIPNVSHHGDATTDELALPKQQRMIAALQDPANWFDGKPDAILFSGGGNDIAGESFCIFLDFPGGPGSGLDEVRFNRALGAVEASYRDLIAFRDRYAEGVPIFAHGYDFPVPNGAHPACIGPWLKPALDYCMLSVAQGRAIIKEALERFAILLDTLETENGGKNNFFAIKTQNTFVDADWANELHPYPEGFEKMAKIFLDRLKGVEAFQTRL